MSFGAILRHIRASDPSFDYLDFYNCLGGREDVLSDPDMLLEFLEALAVNTRITKVNITVRPFKKLNPERDIPRVYSAIGGLPRLESLRIAHPGFNDSSLELVSTCLERTDNLKSLTLHNTRVGRTGELREPHSWNRVIPLRSDPVFSRFLNAVRRLEHLEEIKLSNAFVRSGVELGLGLVVGEILSLKNLHSVSIKISCGLAAPSLSLPAVKAMLFSCQLESLTCANLALKPWINQVLSETTEETEPSALKRLNILDDALNVETALSFAWAIGNNCFPALEALMFQSNQLSNTAGVYLLRALRSQNRVRLLNLSSNHLRESFCTGLARYLQSPDCSLVHLNVAQNEIGEGGIVQIAGALSTNTSLKYLNLSDTTLSLSSSTCAVLCHELAQNHTLENLVLAKLCFGDDSAEFFCSLLRQNRTLESLNISGNQIGIRGKEQIIDSLRGNAILQQLNLNEGNDCKLDLEAIESMLQSNFTLKHLWGVARHPHHNVETYLTLNKLGRKQLIELTENSNNMKHWVDALLGCDLNGVYLLIRAKPMVVSWLQR